MVCEHFLYCFHNFSVNLKLLNVNVYFKKCPFLPESHSCENYLNFPGPQNGRTPKQANNYFLFQDFSDGTE